MKTAIVIRSYTNTKQKEEGEIVVETNAYPLLDAEGNIYAVVETIEDITDITE